MAIAKRCTNYGARIKELRQRSGKLQSEVANAIGGRWSQSDVSLLESGKRALTLDVAAKIAKEIGCTVEDILTEGE